MTTVNVTDDSFEQDVLQAEGAVLVDFWADWCGPCKQITPILEQIGEELSGSLTIAKLDIMESPTTPSRYGVRGIPTLMVFKGGKMVAMRPGVYSKQNILDWLHQAGVHAAA